MKPEWIIYKNEERIGQAITWHKALDILLKQEGITKFAIHMYTGAVFVESECGKQRYKIIKER
jgi:hypothetical protein